MNPQLGFDRTLVFRASHFSFPALRPTIPAAMRGPRDCGALIPERITADLRQELKTGCFPLADGRSIAPCESIAPTQSPSFSPDVGTQGVSL